MAAVAEGIGVRTRGLAGATLACADLERARVFYVVRLGFPLLVDGADAFTFGVGPATVTVRRDGSRAAQAGVDTIALWCTGADELPRVGEALTAAGIAHSGITTHGRLGTRCVRFEDPDGIAWELHAG